MQDHHIKARVDELFGAYRAQCSTTARRWGWGGFILSLLLTPVIVLGAYLAFAPSDVAFAVILVLVGYGLYSIPRRFGKKREKRYAAAMVQSFEEAFPRDGKLFSRALYHLNRHKPESVIGIGSYGDAQRRRHYREKVKFDAVLKLLEIEVFFEDELAGG